MQIICIKKSSLKQQKIFLIIYSKSFNCKNYQKIKLEYAERPEPVAADIIKEEVG